MKSLLSFLKHEHFDELINFENAIANKKIVIHYAIDAHDVGNFCFPSRFGKFNKNSNYDPQLTKQSLIAYQSVFYNRGVKPIILDEYIPELRSLRKKAIKNLEEEQKFANSFTRQEIQKLNLILKNRPDEIKDFIEKNCTELFAIATDSSGVGIKRFKELISERVIIDLEDFEKDDESDGYVLAQAFETVKPTNLSEKIYDFFAKNINENSDGNDDDNILISKFYDANSIDRILSINSFLHEKFVNRLTKYRHIILYLSSAPLSSKLFYESNLLNEYFIDLNGYKLNPLRDKNQIFSKQIYKDIVPAFAVEKLNKLKQIFFKNEISNNSLENNKLLEKTINEINEDKNILINVALFKNFESYHSTLKSILNNDSINLDESSINSLQDLINQCYQQSQDRDWVEVETSLRMTSLNVDTSFLNNIILNDGLKKIFESKDPVFLKSPEDFIVSTYQHLPVLFDFENAELQDIIDEFIINFIEKKNKKYNEIINKLFRQQNTLGVKLLKGLLVILSPDGFGDDNNKLVAEWIEDIILNEILIIELFTNNYSRNKQVEEFKILIDKKDEIIESLNEKNRIIFREYLYFSCWLSRRCGSFEISKSLSEFGSNIYPDDARFNHGHALSSFCIYTKSDSKKIEVLESCIKEAEEAVKKFSNLHITPNRKIICDKIIISLFNSLAYFYAEKYNLNRSKDTVINSRKYIDSLKKLEPNFREFPEYLHTECYIEIQECFIMIEESVKINKEALINKIYFAHDTILTALTMLNNAENKDLKRIEKYNKLFLNILQIISDNPILKMINLFQRN